MTQAGINKGFTLKQHLWGTFVGFGMLTFKYMYM